MNRLTKALNRILVEKKLEAALKRSLVLADFKTVKKKFLDQNASKDEVETYLTHFKRMRDQNRIKENTQKDIDFWGKKSWTEFKEFVDGLKQKTSKTKQKKFKKLEGAELVTQNDEWGVFKIYTKYAAVQYGSGTKWCITQEDEPHWREYSKNNSFYFILSKTRGQEDPFYKIAVQVPRNNNNETFWDARDDKWDDLPDLIQNTLPKFDYVSFENRDFAVLIKDIKENGLTDDSKEAIGDYTGNLPVAYFPEENFLVFEKYDNIDEFIKFSNNDTLKWNLKILSGDEFLEVNQGMDKYDIEHTLDDLKKKHGDLFEKLREKLKEDPQYKDFCEDNDYQNDAYDTNVIAEFIDWDNGDLKLAFDIALSDATRSATEGHLYKTIEKQLKNVWCILMKTSMWEPIYVGAHLNSEELGSIDADGEYSQNEIDDLGVKEFDYEYPDRDEILHMLVEYSLGEYYLNN